MLLLTSSHSFEALAWLFISTLNTLKSEHTQNYKKKYTQIDDMNYAI